MIKNNKNEIKDNKSIFFDSYFSKIIINKNDIKIDEFFTSIILENINFIDIVLFMLLEKYIDNNSIQIIEKQNNNKYLLNINNNLNIIFEFLDFQDYIRIKIYDNIKTDNIDNMKYNFSISMEFIVQKYSDIIFNNNIEELSNKLINYLKLNDIIN